MLNITKTQYFENECCTLTLDPEVGCLTFNWKGLLPSKAFRDVHMQGLSLIRKNKLTKVLWDARRMKTIGSSDSEWLLNYWLPSAVAAGYRYNAIIESDYLFNQHSIDNVIEKAGSSEVIFRSFKDEAAALTWLSNC